MASFLTGGATLRVGITGELKSAMRLSHHTSAATKLLISDTTASVWNARRSFIEHSSDPKKWRSLEKAEIKRRHPGVKLGSEFARIKELGEIEQKLVEADKFTDWDMMWRFIIGILLFLVFLHVLLETVEPNPPPEYTPYIPSSIPTTSTVQK
ncbi:uncharacterized protein TM35_000092620 [Trypanosoma theileri]|uniref:Uncharacterized protein n=1 Tax=Trypanosoma theileri TaxID=67003 RepID=A0A1X0NZW7_9TRYP|nr:uncharacterized protein TM35_000092620 [Trypanosoma theileri]ORC90212.1 hypothetical protein TM35_000092620 [Trypanosoma theileri]